MTLNYETIFDVYTFKRKKFLCLIKVDRKSQKFNNNCRCLTQEQWAMFDKKLEKLLTASDKLDEKSYKFSLKPFIEVKVQKSKLSFKHFYKVLGTIGELNESDDAAAATDQNLIFECLIDFQQELSFSFSIGSQETTLYGATCSPLSYDPYTPTMKTYNTDIVNTVRTPGIDFLKYGESSYSQKPILAEEDNSTLLTEIMQNSGLNQTNATSSLSENNSDENLNEALTECKHKLDSQNSDQKDVEKIKNSIISPNEDKHIQIESRNKLPKTDGIQERPTTGDANWESHFRSDNSGKHKERPKSADIFLLLNDEDNKKKYRSEKHRSENEKYGRDKDYSRYQNKLRNRSKTIDEFSKELLPDTGKTLPENIMENVIKRSHKRTDTHYKFISQQKEKKIKVSSSKGISTSDNQHVSPLTEDEPTSTYTIKTTKTSKSPILENDNSEELCPQKLIRKERTLKPSINDKIISVRRSERSPSKPKRFTEEQTQVSIKAKKHKSHKKRELFGTDDDEDNLFEAKKEKNNNDKKNKLLILESPVGKKPVQSNSSSSSSSSKKKKRKRDNGAECHEEKRCMSKWLSKKNSKPSDHKSNTTSKNTSKPSQSKPLPLKTLTNVKSCKIESEAKTREKSLTPPPMTIELLSKDELELMRNKTNLMREENAKMKAELDKMRISPPKEVEILSLENISVADILNTFSTHKAELDEVYHNNRKKDHIKGHDGINHCFIIRLLRQSVQMKMLQKLTDIYGGSNTTTQATLFANALLPEWVIRVYMEKFNFTRQQAIDQIKAQEAFQLHMEEQNENSFEFD